MAMSDTQRPVESGQLFGHPRGLTFLFTTEMWERFSYYGMRSLLILYMVKFVLLPENAGAVIGLGALRSFYESIFGPLGAQPFASHLYGLYTALVYLTPLIGGLLADRVLGQRRTVVLGASLMAIGHFMMAFEPLFLLALLVLIFGNGAFKPNISAQIGGLYAPGDPRRDRAYSIFYVGINLGAFLAPLVCGTLGEGVGWHYGFGAAGVGMTIGLIVYLYAQPMLPADERDRVVTSGNDRRPLDRTEWRSILALMALFLPTSLFWATYEQQGNTIPLWADDYTDRHINLLIWHGEIPVTWFQAFNPFMIFAFTPFVLMLWARQAARGREPSTVTKMAVGCFGVALANLIMVGAVWQADGATAGELDVAVRLFRHHHRGRALSLADRAFAGVEGVARAHGLDADGRVVLDQFRRQSGRRLARQLLDAHGQVGVLPDDCRRRSPCRAGHPGVQPAAARRAGRIALRRPRASRADPHEAGRRGPN